MPYVEATIIGTGTERDPFRADVPLGLKYTAHIPSKPDGTPKFLTAVVWIRPGQFIDPSLTQISRDEAVEKLRVRSDRVDDSSLTHMERT